MPDHTQSASSTPPGRTLSRWRALIAPVALLILALGIAAASIMAQVMYGVVFKSETLAAASARFEAVESWLAVGLGAVVAAVAVLRPSKRKRGSQDA